MNDNDDFEVYEIYMSVTTPGGEKLNLRRIIPKVVIEASLDVRNLMGLEIDWSARELKDALGEHMEHQSE